MRKYWIASLTFVVFSFTACKKNIQKRYDAIDYPANRTVDINGDGTKDFSLNYDQIATEDVPVSAATVSLSIIGMGSNTVLTQNNESSLFLNVDDSIFLRPGVTDSTLLINFSPDTTLVWQDTSSAIITKSWDGKKWATYWSINATHNAPYYFGYRQIIGSDTTLGWVRLTINQETGETEIRNFGEGSSNAPYIITNN